MLFHWSLRTPFHCSVRLTSGLGNIFGSSYDPTEMIHIRHHLKLPIYLHVSHHGGGGSINQRRQPYVE